MRLMSTEEPAATEEPVAEGEPTAEGEPVAEEETQQEPPREEGGAQSVAAVMRAAVQHYRKRIRENEPVVREGKDPEGVHDMRVATRALRAALDVFVEVGALSSDDARVLSRRLRRLARALGQVRDLDVLMQRAAEYVAANRGVEGLLAEWTAHLSRQRSQAERHLLRMLDGRDYTRLRRGLKRLAKREDSPARQPILVRQCAGSAIWRRYEATLACEACGPQGTPEALHALRIRCKQLRYVVDVFEGALGSDIQLVHETLVRSQKVLGSAHDISTLLAALERFGCKHTGTVGLREYTEAEARQLTTLMVESALVQAELDGEPFRHALASAIAAL